MNVRGTDGNFLDDDGNPVSKTPGSIDVYYLLRHDFLKSLDTASRGCVGLHDIQHFRY